MSKILGSLVAMFLSLVLVFPTLVMGQAASDQTEELNKLAWQSGPGEGRIGTTATIKIPKGYVFLDSQNTRRFLELAGNPPSDNNFLFAPESLAWFSVFSFDASGHVKDDEKIDPDELLKALKESDAPRNEERKRLGMEPIFTDGWVVPPHYDAQTKRLEWGVRLNTQEGPFVANYTSRLLGRTGVMSAVLVSDLNTLAADTQSFKAALKQFDYVPGEKYSEFKEGDKLAEYGLGALILGGAAAVATKKGLWAVLGGFLAASWKVIAAVGVAVAAGLGKLFKRQKEQ